MSGSDMSGPSGNLSFLSSFAYPPSGLEMSAYNNRGLNNGLSSRMNGGTSYQAVQQQMAAYRQRTQMQSRRTSIDSQSRLATRRQRADRTRQLRADRIARAKAKRESRDSPSTANRPESVLVSLQGET